MTDILADAVEAVARALYQRHPHYYRIDVTGRAGPVIKLIPWEEVGNTSLISVCQDARAAIDAYENWQAGSGALK